MLRYNPAFDGLRALAVVAVLAFHMDALGGGYLGVDMFLVLSGFLITSLMLSEHQRTGAISIPAFYLRRVYRLLPGFLLFLAIGAVLVLTLRGKQNQINFFENALAALLYVNNYFRVYHRTPNEGGSWLGHVWSLSLEEQFYLIWPLCLVVLCTRPRLRARLPGLLLAAVGCVVGWRLLLIAGGADDQRIYFGLDTRADSLLMGCALAALRQTGYRWKPVAPPSARSDAFSPGLAPRAIAEPEPSAPVARRLAALGPWAFAALLWLAVVAPALDVEITWLDRAGYTLVALLAALLILSADQEGPRWWRSLLASKPLAGLGRISYGFYLWHYPVAAVSAARVGPALGRPAAVACATAASIAIAAFSARFVERPIQRRCPAWARNAAAAPAATAPERTLDLGASTQRGQA